MMPNKPDAGTGPDILGRRRLLVTLAAGAATTLAACGRRDFSCAQSASLSAADNAMRTTFGYRDRGTDPERWCERCNHFGSAGRSSCGTCRLVHGPIHPQGTCNVFALRT